MDNLSTLLQLSGVSSREAASQLGVGSRLVRYWADTNRPERPSQAQLMALAIYCVRKQQGNAGPPNDPQYKRDPVARRK